MVKRAQTLKQRLPSVRAVLKGQGDTAQLQTLLLEAKALNVRSLAFGEWGVSALLVPKAIATDAAKLCQDSFERLSKSTGAITAWELDGDKLQLKGAITDTKSVMEQILTVWQRAWSGGIGGEFAGLDDLARLLEDVRGGKDAAEKLRKAAMLGQTVKDVATPGSPVREKLAKARQLLKEALELLAESGGGSEVVEFLSAVARGSCTLVLVNEKILNWLKTNGQLAKFRVLRSASSGTSGF
jgi:hypothetical protein